MNPNLVANASITVDAPRARVWRALVDPQAIKAYMFGTNITTDWQPGSGIVFQGEWQGRPYEDKGTVLRVEPERTLQYTHYSPSMGKPDLPENYHTVTISLAEDGAGTRVTLSQDNNDTAEAQQHSQKNWEMMLAGLKKYVET